MDPPWHPQLPKWERSNERRCEARDLKRHGVELSGERAALTRFTLVDFFADRTVRRPLIGSFLMMLSVTFAFWGVSTFIPTYVGSIAAKAGLPAAHWAGLAGLVTGVCGVLGFVSLGFLADLIGRRAIAMLFYLMCLILTPVVYLWAQNIYVLLFCVGVFGFFTLGIWVWAPIWLPELFPTRMRSTAIAFFFNAPRFIACRPIDCRHPDRRARRLWAGGNDHRVVLLLGFWWRHFCPRPTEDHCLMPHNRRIVPAGIA